MNITSTREEEVVNDENEKLIITMDLIQCFPAEIAISIIQAALPSDGSYLACLMDLTNVSRTWQTLLLYTPLLWSQLYIDETQPDILALLSLSIQLADRSPLKVVLFDRPIHDWTGIGSLLLMAYERVTNLAIVMTIEQIGFASHAENCASALTAFFDRLGYPPNLTDLIFDDRLTSSLSWPAVLSLPPMIFLVGTFDLEVPNTSKVGSSGRLFDKVEYENIRRRRHRMNDLSHLRPLSLTYNHKDQESVKLVTGARLPRSEYPANPLGECDSIEQLLYIAASSICSLTLVIDPALTRDLMDCLLELCNLQVFDLTISVKESLFFPKLTQINHVITTLQELKFAIWKLPPVVRWDKDWVPGLFHIFTKLYPCLQRLHLRAEFWPFNKSSWLEGWKTLKYLRSELRDMIPLSVGYSLKLLSLQTLRLDGSPPPCQLMTPNLYRLILNDEHLENRLSSINPHSLRILVVYFEQDLGNFDEDENYNFNLEPMTCPDLRELYLVLYGAVPQWRSKSFSHLVLIKFHSPERFNNPLGDLLCLHLIYYPESCPSLQELSSDRCFEWDLLFLMLQQRNFGRRKIVKIQTVTMPFVSFAFRQHLEHLLAGNHSKGPSLISQSLEATREVIFDANILGCYCCLKNQRPNCTEKLKEDHGSFWHEDELYPKPEKPPATTALEIRNHILWRDTLVEEWKKCYTACEFRREEACNRWL